MVFGITGDLAKVMTFRSLYRLEQRGLLTCPIVGVAVDDWTVDQLVERARESIEGTGEQLDPRGVRPLRGAALLRARRLRRRGHVRARRRGDQGRRAARLLPGDPAVPLRHRRQGPGRGRPDRRRGRVVVEKPFGHDQESARALADELHQYIDESQLYRIDHFLGKMGLEELLYLRFANTMLEPVWNRNYVECVADHDGRELRRRGPRPLLRSSRRAARRRGQPPHAGGRCHRDGAAVGRRSRDAQGRDGRPLPRGRGCRPGSLRPRPVRRLPRHRRRRSGLDHRDVRRPAPRHRELALVGVPFFIRTGKHLPATQTEVRLVFKRPPRLGFGSSKRRHRSPTSSWSSSIPRPGSGSCSTRTGPMRPSAEPITSTWSSPRRAARDRPPTRCCSTQRWSAQSTRFTRQDGVEETWRIMQPLLDAPPPVHRYPPGSWGPAAADKLVAGHGRWHGPWVTA